MRDDKLLRQLAQMMEEEAHEAYQRLDARWDRLSDGTLAPEEEAALRALAETSDEAREAYEAFRPLDADYRARVVRALKAERRDAAAHATDSPAVAAEAPRARILPFIRRPGARVGGWLAAAAALAAAFFGPYLLHVRMLPPLPAYALLLDGGVQELREELPAGETADPVFVPGSRFELILRPETAVSKPSELELRLFLERGGELRRWQVPAEPDPSGAWRVAVENLAIAPGEWTLWALLGRPKALPDDDELRSLAGEPAPSTRHWVLLNTTLKIEPRP